MEQVNQTGNTIGQKEGDAPEVQVLPRKKARNPTVQERKKRKKKKSNLQRRSFEVEVIPARKAMPDGTPEAPKKRVAAYCRVSTEEEAQASSFELQVEHYTKYIGAHEDWILAGIYADEGISGTQVKHREQFLQMIEDCKAGKIDMIITKSISRFARNVLDCLSTIKTLKGLNPQVGIYFEKENIDSLDEKSDVFLTMLASFAQEESRSISSNIRWAIRNRMKEGTQKIPTNALYGYDTDDDGNMVVVESEAEVIRTIYRKFVQGTHPADIADGLNEEGITTVMGNPWSSSAVKNILRNEKYCGDLVQWKRCSIDFLTKKVIHNQNENPDTPVIALEDHHEAIISKELFYAAQELLDERGQSAREGRRFSSTYWFSNKVVCGKCGTHFSKTGSKKIRNPMIRCSNRAAYGTEPHVCANGRHVNSSRSTIRNNTPTGRTWN